MIAENLVSLKKSLPIGVKLVAVSKKKPVADIKAAYETGQLDFGENYVQELVDKHAELPKDIHWHFIGHLQRNKVKYITPFVHLIHGVDSQKLLKEIQKQGKKLDRKINVLLQVHIAKEESKFGFDEEEILAMLDDIEFGTWDHVSVRGLMGMATNTQNTNVVKDEFEGLQKLYHRLRQHEALSHQHFTELSMGMTQDFTLALDYGSSIVRIGSAIFGKRN